MTVTISINCDCATVSQPSAPAPASSGEILPSGGNDTAAVQAALDGGGVVRLGPGEFHLDWIDILQSGTRIVGEEGATTLRFADPNGPSIRIGTDGAYVESPAFVGLRFTQDPAVKQPLFEIMSARDVRLVDCEAGEIYAGILWGSATAATLSNQLLLRNSRINLRAGHSYGIRVAAARGGLQLENSYLTGQWADIVGVTDNGSGLCRVETALPHGFTTGDAVGVYGVKGATMANTAGATVTVVDATHFDIDGSTFGGVYVADTGAAMKTSAIGIEFVPNAVIPRFDWVKMNGSFIQGFISHLKAINYRVVNVEIVGNNGLDGHLSYCLDLVATDTSGPAGGNIGFNGLKVIGARAGMHTRGNGAFMRLVSTAAYAGSIMLVGNKFDRQINLAADIVTIQTDAAYPAEGVVIAENIIESYDRVWVAGRSAIRLIGPFRGAVISGNVATTGSTGNRLAYCADLDEATGKIHHAGNLGVDTLYGDVAPPV